MLYDLAEPTLVGQYSVFRRLWRVDDFTGGTPW